MRRIPVLDVLALLPLLALSGCPTAEPECQPTLAAYTDADGDGFGQESLGLVCALEAGMSESPLDCDDASDAVFPGAREKCNDVDDDCDGTADEEFRKVVGHRDADGDGAGAPFDLRYLCEPEEGWVANGNDCDDDDPDRRPGAREVCGGGDEDCDGLDGEFDDDVDPASFLTFYRDSDLDSFGDPDVTTRACAPPNGYVTAGNDCDDHDIRTTRFLFYEDADRDGYGNPDVQVSGCEVGPGLVINHEDCDDTDPVILDERDWYDDDDGDGWGAGTSVAFGCTGPRGAVNLLGDCDESDPDENPDTPEVCDDGTDENCDGRIDCDDSDCNGFPGCTPPCADDALDSVVPLVENGSTNGQGDDNTPTCAFSNAQDVAFEYTAPSAGSYTIDTVGSNYDTVLYVLDGCGGAELDCNDDSVGLRSRVNVYLDAGQTVIIVVDGYDNNRGAFQLNVSL